MAPEGPSQTSGPFPGLHCPILLIAPQRPGGPNARTPGLTSGTLATHEIKQQSPWKWSLWVSSEPCRAPDSLPNWAPTTGDEKGAERQML